MASGEPALLLTEVVSWHDFPAFAEAFVCQLDGVITDRADSSAERVWTAQIQGGTFWVSFDDFPGGVFLEPQDSEAGRLIPGIRDTLKQMRSKRGTV
jgi:hypothetical protein